MCFRPVATDCEQIHGTRQTDRGVLGKAERRAYPYENGFLPASRRQVFARLKPLIISKCPFVNLPEAYKGRWGEGLTAADMEKCVWVRPQLVERIEFLEWTASDHLRHSKFAGLREDKDPRKVIKEHAGEA